MAKVEAGSPINLTPREVDILTRITNGMSNDEIASDLYVSINTIKTYVRSSYRKIGVARRSQAVVWGVRNGLLAKPE